MRTQMIHVDLALMKARNASDSKARTGAVIDLCENSPIYSAYALHSFGAA